jgi:RimJ/RimL family protein N-acetyltransferase
MNECVADICIKPIEIKDNRFLFQLLSERKSNENISHKKMPSYLQHVEFVASKPYKKWHIIYNKNKKIGSIYISKQNEIGLFFKTNEWKQDIANKCIKLLMKINHNKRYLVNINPKNKKMVNFYKKRGFKLIQHTFELCLEE